MFGYMSVGEKWIGRLKLRPFAAGQAESEYPDIPARLLTIVDNTKWNLSDSRYNDATISSTFPFILELTCLHLLLNHNNRPSIIREIQHIRFTELRELSLTGNRIESIEALSRIWMPLLNNLLLGYNSLTSIRPLMHLAAHCQQLQWLSLEQNPIRELWQIPLLFANPGEMFGFLELSKGTGKLGDFLLGWVHKMPANFNIL